MDMGKFYDQIEALKNIEGDYPGDWMDTLVSAYDDDATALMADTETANSRIAEMEAERDAMVAAHAAEIVSIKAAKYDEIMSQPVNDSDESDDNDSDDDIDDDGDVDPIEKLFS